MDTGAHNVIVSMVNCKDDAMNAVKNTPVGTRGGRIRKSTRIWF